MRVEDLSLDKQELKQENGAYKDSRESTECLSSNSDTACARIRLSPSARPIPHSPSTILVMLRLLHTENGKLGLVGLDITIPVKYRAH